MDFLINWNKLRVLLFLHCL